MRVRTWGKLLGTGLLLGLVAGLWMTLVMLLLRVGVGVSPPPEAVPDRIAPTVRVNDFFRLLRQYGGYNGLKQFGVSAGLLAQLAGCALGGALYVGVAAWERARHPERAMRWGAGRIALTVLATAILALWVASLVVLASVLGANYRGLPPSTATTVTSLGLLLAYASYAVALVLLTRWVSRSRPATAPGGTGPIVGRRTALVAGVGAMLALASGGMLRLLYGMATFSYDGMRNRGPRVTPLTPNDAFYVVTKNVVDPRVAQVAWGLEVGGRVELPRTYGFADIARLDATTQETTLMCISNGVGDKLISNALWKGVPMRALLEASRPLPGNVEVLLRGADGYTDTFALEKAMEPTTLLVYEMNGEPLPERHGYPVRVIVPGLFGEKNVKWVTGIELVDRDVKGFYEQQGWGPRFEIPIRSGFYAPDFRDPVRLGSVVALSGFAFSGDDGVSRVEISLDGGRSWTEAEREYPGTRLSWSLWRYEWRPAREGAYRLLVRAFDASGAPQPARPRGIVPQGATGLHGGTLRVVA